MNDLIGIRDVADEHGLALSTLHYRERRGLITAHRRSGQRETVSDRITAIDRQVEQLRTARGYLNHLYTRTLRPGAVSVALPAGLKWVVQTRNAATYRRGFRPRSVSQRSAHCSAKVLPVCSTSSTGSR